MLLLEMMLPHEKERQKPHQDQHGFLEALWLVITGLMALSGAFL